jgi:hypothetical protein
MNADERKAIDEKRKRIKRLLGSYETLINECQGTFSTYLYPAEAGSENWDAPTLCRRHLREDLPQLIDAIHWVFNALDTAEQRME